MHPALSIILFTTLSGAGLGLGSWSSLLPLDNHLPLTTAAIAITLTGSGLCCSVFHLRRPDRAWRALSQWRSSWLSREGILAPLALAAIFAQAAIPHASTILGPLAAALCTAALFATAMIYAQLRTVAAWRTAWTPITFILLAAAGGSLLLAAITAWSNSSHPLPPLAIASINLLAWLSVIAGWHHRDHIGTGPASTASAIGLKEPKAIRLFEPPHIGGNYLTREMVFVVARKHARKLRFIALALGLASPLLLLALPLSALPLTLATATHLLGVGIARWLFFAEARHSVSLYYGSPSPA